MRAVYCDTAQCKKGGNENKEIRVWGTGSQKHKRHKIKCPREDQCPEVNLESVCTLPLPLMDKNSSFVSQCRK